MRLNRRLRKGRLRATAETFAFWNVLGAIVAADVSFLAPSRLDATNSLRSNTMNFIKKMRFAAFAVALLSGFSAAKPQDSAGQDVKAAAKDTGDATKKVATKTADGTKTAAKATAKGTKTAAVKTGDASKTAATKTAEATDTAAKDTAKGTKTGVTKTGSGIKKGAVKVAGKDDAKPADTTTPKM